MNVELLTKVMNKLKRMRHKQHFDMDDFFQKNECGTAACIAGHVLIEAGYKPRFEKDGDGFGTVVVSPKGRRVDAETAAKNLLRLSRPESELLFHAWNWPEEFGGESDGLYSGQPEIYNDPKVAAKRIERFIATKGKE